MKKKYSTKRSLIASILILCLCFTSFVGTTFAWFTDEVTSANNIIKSGNLDVTMEWKDATATGKQQSYKDASEGAIFNYDKWEPGYVEAKNIKIGNAGTLALKYQVAIVATGEISKLADVIDVYYAEGEYTLSGRSMTELTKLGTLTDVLSKLSDTANGDLEAGKSDTITLALKMQESAGNEYMNLSIGSEFAVKCFATQLTSESDSFGTDYDKDADFPHFLFGSAMVVENATAPYTLPLKNFKGGKQGSATVRPASVDPNATDITATVKEVLTDSNFTVYDSATQSVITLDVTVTGLVPGNTTPVKIETHIPAGLTGVELYHKDTKIESTYKEENGTGILIFESATFSPFNIVYDTIPVEEEVNPEEQAPKANVVKSTEFENVALPWNDDLGLMPSKAGQSLEAVYTFTAPHTSETVDDSKYKDWYCDFYVMCSGEDGAKIPEGALVLGGNYGTWGWIGFDSPEVDANVEIPLLGSVTQNPWTYESIVDWVGTFICGVAHNDHDVDGETFTVILRLTNPDNENDTIEAARIEYTFPKCPVVSTVDELNAALAAGGEVILDADLNVDVSTTGFVVNNGVDAKIDLNGHDIIATSTSAEGVQLFSVSGNLEIVGEGTISLKNDNFAWSESYRYTAINIRETGVVTLGEGVNIVCEAGANTEKGYAMSYAVDIYTTGTLNVNGASLHSNYIAVRCFFGNSVVNVNSGSITSSRNNWGIWPQSASGAVITIADGIAYTTDEYGIYIFK